MAYYKRKRDEIIAETYDGTDESVYAFNLLLTNIGASAVKVEGTTNVLISGTFGKFMILVNEVLTIDESRGASKMSSEELNKYWEL